MLGRAMPEAKMEDMTHTQARQDRNFPVLRLCLRGKNVLDLNQVADLYCAARALQHRPAQLDAAAISATGFPRKSSDIAGIIQMDASQSRLPQRPPNRASIPIRSNSRSPWRASQASVCSSRRRRLNASASWRTPSRPP